MNKYELAKKITQLEGLTNEEKALLVELLRSQKKYGLVWEDKPEEIETRLVDELPVLTEVPERAKPYTYRGRQPRSAHRSRLYTRGQNRRDIYRSALQYRQ